MSPKADSIGKKNCFMTYSFIKPYTNLSFFFILVSFFGDLFIDEPLPKDGYVELPHDKYGFGVTLNRDGLTMTRPYPRNEQAK